MPKLKRFYVSKLRNIKFLLREFKVNSFNFFGWFKEYFFVILKMLIYCILQYVIFQKIIVFFNNYVKSHQFSDTLSLSFVKLIWREKAIYDWLHTPIFSIIIDRQKIIQTQQTSLYDMPTIVRWKTSQTGDETY